MRDLTLEKIKHLQEESYWFKQRLLDYVLELLIDKNSSEELITRARHALERSKVRSARRFILYGMFRGFYTQTDMDKFILRNYNKDDNHGTTNN